MKNLFYLQFLFLMLLSSSLFAQTVVTNTNDSGTGSLRAAIDYANSTAGVQTITFDIPGTGPHWINGQSLLIINGTDAVIIDGTTQPGYKFK